jgi:4-hydroxy-tetrahydrodipicolinate reductase
MTTIVMGDGGLGRAVTEAFQARGGHIAVLGRPDADGHDPAIFAGASLAIEASRGDAVRTNIRAALAGGVRRFVIATTAWDADRAAVEADLRSAGASAVAAANFSIGVALFGRLVDTAVELFGGLEAFDPYIIEWHRRSKRDRPSGTAAMLARRIVDAHPRKTRVASPSLDQAPAPDELEVVAVRAGASPGMHLVGFDAPGESVELRLTARDRSAYAAGILAAADWLARASRPAGLHPFDPVVDDLLGGTARAAVVAA